MTNTSSTPSSSAQWHTISPHTRPLTLTVLELTPLALTLSLSLTPPAPSHSHSHTSASHLVHNNHHTHAQSPSHSKSNKKRPNHSQSQSTPRGKKSSGGAGGDLSGEEDGLEGEDLDYSALVESSSFKDLLSHGVVVSVNGQPWTRIYAHVSEDEDSELDWEDTDLEDQNHLSLTGSSGSGSGSTIVVGGGGSGEREENIEEGSITRRRPRKPRFGTAALTASSQSSNDKDLVLSGASNTGSIRRKGGKEKMDKDRAVVVVYGLSPGKEYEVELRVVGLFSQEGSDGLVSTSVLIPPSPTPNAGLHPRSRANSLRSRSRPRSRSNSLTGATPGHLPSSSPLSHNRSSDAIATLDALAPGSHDTLSPDTAAIMPTPVLNAVDTQTAQLRHLIATAHAEKEHLQTQIKEARRTSQRQEAALKVEIENVKKAIEKAGSMDLRSKQKALATQEQVKQGWAGAELAEKDSNKIENYLDTLELKLESLKIEVESIQSEFKSINQREEELKERDKKQRSEEDKKLTEVLSKIDKLKTKKVKRESEKVELEKKLEDLEKQQEDVEKKNEFERNSRKNNNASYYAAGYGQHNNNHNETGHGQNLNVQRSLSAHPSLNNLNGHYAAGPAYRPRGNNLQGYQPRFPSAGSTLHHHRPSPTQQQQQQPSPTHPNNFYPIQQHPIPPSNTTSPAFRPPKLANQPTRSTSGPTPSSSNSTPGNITTQSSGGVNAAALPFHPSNFSPNNEPPHHHTTLMPPQLQHRIYLPNVRPRPTPNFHPPPSVLAEQARDQNQNQTKSTSSSGSGNSPALNNSTTNDNIGGSIRSPNHSPPAFPPLPAVGGNSNNNNNSGGGAGKSNSTGPSLASIVTRAVLSPTSALAQQSQAANLGNVASSVLKNPQSHVQSHGNGDHSGEGTIGSNSRKNSNSTSPIPTPPSSAGLNSRLSNNTNSSNNSNSTIGGGQEFPPLSPTWNLGLPIRRENTPPISGIWGSAGSGINKDGGVKDTGGKEKENSIIGNAILRKPSRSGSGENTSAN